MIGKAICTPQFEGTHICIDVPSKMTPDSTGMYNVTAVFKPGTNLAILVHSMHSAIFDAYGEDVPPNFKYPIKMNLDLNWTVNFTSKIRPTLYGTVKDKPLTITEFGLPKEMTAIVCPIVYNVRGFTGVKFCLYTLLKGEEL
jgi:hypothetical protein